MTRCLVTIAGVGLCEVREDGRTRYISRALFDYREAAHVRSVFAALGYVCVQAHPIQHQPRPGHYRVRWVVRGRKALR